MRGTRPIDTSGYEPADVARSSALDLGHLVFVSTCNVYPAWPAEPVDEDSPVWTEGDDYGPLKAACERVAQAAMPGRVASVRAGLICGPHDNIFRLPWWVRRIAAGGDVVAPGDPERTVQLVDARDLAAWMVDLAEQRVAGAFNGTAPPGRTTMREVLEAAVEATGSGARLHWVPDDVLVAHEVEPWDELPLWIPRRRPARGRGRWAPSARRRPGCAAARSPRRWPTRGRGCATAARTRLATGAPRTARAASAPSASASCSPCERLARWRAS